MVTSVPPKASRYELPPVGSAEGWPSGVGDQLARKDFVHDLGAGGDHCPQFAAVHDPRGTGARVPGQAGDLLPGTPELDMRLSTETSWPSVRRTAPRRPWKRR